MKLQMPQTEDDDDIDLTPLIDCVFLLVLFFMVTSSFIDEAKAFKITLPHADSAITVARESADTISISATGKIHVRSGTEEKEIEDLDELRRKLRPADRAGPQRPVIIRCDARCEYQRFIQVKNVLKLAGVETVFEEVEVRNEKKP